MLKNTSITLFLDHRNVLRFVFWPRRVIHVSNIASRTERSFCFGSAILCYANVLSKRIRQKKIIAISNMRPYYNLGKI